MKPLRITIIGLGLIGGSLGKAFKAAQGGRVAITGVDACRDSLALGVEIGAIDYAAEDCQDGVREADVVFLCTPVLQMLPMLEQCAPALPKGCIVTDVGSTKAFVSSGIRAHLPDCVEYVSGHPMAGREKSGIQAADAELFVNKCYLLLPDVSTSAAAVEKIAELAAWTGACVRLMDSRLHDHGAALMSHIPHVAAAALVHLLDACPSLEVRSQLIGGGFRDTTRIASSNADMWADVCMTNPEAILAGMQELQTILTQMTTAIEAKNRPAVHDFFTQAKKKRDALLSASHDPSWR